MCLLKRRRQYLCVAVESGVVQGGATPAVWHIDTAQQRDDDLSAAECFVGGGNM